KSRSHRGHSAISPCSAAFVNAVLARPAPSTPRVRALRIGTMCRSLSTPTPLLTNLLCQRRSRKPLDPEPFAHVGRALALLPVAELVRPEPAAPNVHSDPA